MKIPLPEHAQYIIYETQGGEKKKISSVDYFYERENMCVFYPKRSSESESATATPTNICIVKNAKNKATYIL